MSKKRDEVLRKATAILTQLEKEGSSHLSAIDVTTLVALTMRSVVGVLSAERRGFMGESTAIDRYRTSVVRVTQQRTTGVR